MDRSFESLLLLSAAHRPIHTTPPTPGYESTPNMSAAVELDLVKPDDFHHHFRDGDALSALVPLVAKRFRRAVS